MAAIPDKDQRCLRILQLVDEGKGVCESCREVGVSEKTFYRWRRGRESQ
jgi:putative transposase